MDWEALLVKEIMPPFKPNVDSQSLGIKFEPGITSSDVSETKTEVAYQKFTLFE